MIKIPIKQVEKVAFMIFLGFIVSILMVISCQSTKGHKEQELAKLKKIVEQAEDEPTVKDYWSETDKLIHADYLFLRAEFETLEDNSEKASQFYQDSYELKSNGFVAWKMLLSTAEKEELPEALIKAKKLVLQYPKNEYLRTTYGSLLAKQGLYKDAIFSFKKSILINSRYVQAYLNLVEIYRIQKKMKDAMIIAQKLVDQNPQLPEGWATVAKLHLGNNQKDKALFSSKRAFDLQSRNPEYMLLYALSLEINGQSKNAVILYEKLFRINPTNEELITKMVRLYRQIGSLEDALALLDEVLKSTDSQNSALLLQKSFILWELKKFEESSKLLVNLAKKNPNSDRINYLTALGKEKIQKPAEALEFFNKVEIGSEFYPHAKFRSVNIYKNQKKYQLALTEAYSALDSDEKNSTEFYLIIAKIYEEKKEIVKSIDILQKGVDRFPSSANLHFNLGVYFEKDNKISECIREMKKVIELDSKFSSAYNYLGYLYAENNRNLDEAEKMVLTALELRPNDGYYMDSLGWIYFKQNHLDKALKTLLKANELAKNEGVILEHIGDVYQAKQELNKALEYYQNASKGKLEERDRNRIEAKYQNLKRNFNKTS